MPNGRGKIMSSCMHHKIHEIPIIAGAKHYSETGLEAKEKIYNQTAE
jgi:hypothetical protein